MQEASLQPLQPLVMSFSEFLAALFQALEGEGLRPCVLRNYEEFPQKNLGNDVDLLIPRAKLQLAIRALRSIQGIRLVGYSERPSVALTFIEGISQSPELRALQVDFIMGLAWKGLPSLTTEAVLGSAIRREADDVNFFVPSPAHEAIISLLSSLLGSGSLKEKYLPQVQRTFARDRSEVVAALEPQFGLKTGTRLVDSVIDGNRQGILDCVGPLRSSLARRSLQRRPVQSGLAVVRHYAREVQVRFSPKNVESVCILGPTGCGKTSVLEGLMPLLHSSAQTVEKHQFGQPLTLVSQLRVITPGVDSDRGVTRGPLATMISIALWLAKDWLSQFFGKRNLTLRICEGSYHDLLIDPQRYSYGGPAWFARVVCSCSPPTDLWILLDPTGGAFQSRDQTVPSEEMPRQLEAYRSFVKTKTRYVTVDASNPIACVTEEAYAAIIDMLAQRSERQLRNHF